MLLNDIDTRRGNIDHVLVGPPGVFAGVLANWNGRQVPAVEQIKRARAKVSGKRARQVRGNTERRSAR
jgi:hypothetical protein